MAKSREFVLRHGDQVAPRVFAATLVYRVERSDGNVLSLKAVGRKLRGWALAEEVVPLGQAINFFSDQIRIRPNDAFSFAMRAVVWLESDQLDRSRKLRRGNSAGRHLAPAYFRRGVIWAESKEYDKAIADFNEAIRFEKGEADLYYRRGDARESKNDDDRAIADYAEAINLDRDNRLAYTARGLAWNRKKDFDKAIADHTEAIRLASQSASATATGAWPGGRRMITTRPSRITPRPSNSILAAPTSTQLAACFG